jgi:hypothetical protein
MDDLISRAAAISWFFRPYSNEEYYSNLDVERALKAIPAVDAVLVAHGEWKWSHGGVCSECGFHNSNFDYRYCPMCGAKMDGERRDSK